MLQLVIDLGIALGIFAGVIVVMIVVAAVTMLPAKLINHRRYGWLGVTCVFLGLPLITLSMGLGASEAAASMFLALIYIVMSKL